MYTVGGVILGWLVGVFAAAILLLVVYNVFILLGVQLVGAVAGGYHGHKRAQERMEEAPA